MDPGIEDVTYAQTEKIGLPGWSFVVITASARGEVVSAQADQLYDFYFSVVDAAIMEVVDDVAHALKLWAGDTLQKLDEGDKQALVPQGLGVKSTDVSFTMKETYGLPEKSSIDIFASNKRAADPGFEFGALRAAAERVKKQMGEKRALVRANPRPWCSVR